jgi:thymidine kinase
MGVLSKIILGPMFSGKSSELIRICSCHEAVGERVMYVNHKLDVRCKNEVATHSNIKRSAVKCDILSGLELDNIDVIGIDEAQFFPDLLDFVKKVISHNGSIQLYIAGLDGDFKQQPFGEILYCIPFSKDVIKLNARCMSKDSNGKCCGSRAQFTRRINASEKLILISAAEEYEAVCAEHHSFHLF